MAKKVFKRHHFEQIAPEAVKQATEKIDQATKDKEVDKKVRQESLYYNADEDCFYCPTGQ